MRRTRDAKLIRPKRTYQHLKHLRQEHAVCVLGLYPNASSGRRMIYGPGSIAAQPRAGTDLRKCVICATTDRRSLPTAHVGVPTVPAPRHVTPSRACILSSGSACILLNAGLCHAANTKSLDTTPRSTAPLGAGASALLCTLSPSNGDTPVHPG
jgi:hypothetical protein